MRLNAIPLLVISLLFLNAATAQSISSILRHDQPEDIRNRKASAIVEEYIFYNIAGEKTYKSIKKLNSTNRLLSLEYAEPSRQLKNRITFEYDSTDLHSISRVKETWYTAAQHLKSTTYYTYDTNGYLIKQIEKDAQDTLLVQTILKNNEEGHPVELVLFDGYGTLIGKETATYDYDENTVQTQVIGKNNMVHNSGTFVIDLAKAKEATSEGVTYNAQGDIVKTDTHEHDYKYDSYGNWTEQKVYRLVRGKRKIEYIYKRTIYYYD